MNRSLFLVVGSLLFALSSCRFNPNLQGKGADFIQGVWQEDSISYRADLLQYTTHQFKFTCDSFYVTLNTVAKTNIYPDSCFNEGKWTEYAKGNYAVRNDSLHVYGTFTKPNFKQKISGCYRIGQYLETFIIKSRSVESIELISLKQHLPLKLSLKQKITCIQKPLN
jgi:hypothetical protein